MYKEIFDALESELTTFVAYRSPALLQLAVEKGCYVYGAGSYGRRIVRLLLDHNLPCRGIIDRKFNEPGLQVDGIPAFHPSEMTGEIVAGNALLIGVHNRLVDLGEIIQFGKNIGFNEILWNADLPDLLGEKADNYWLTNRSFMLAHFSQLREVVGLLSDQTSVDTLASLVRYRVTGDLLTQPKFNLHEQYLPPRLMRFDGPITFVDGGAYDGDTFRHLSAAGVEISHWIAFEPDPRNFVALTKFAGSLQIPSTMFPCGLNDTFMQVAFSANEGTSSHLTSSLKAEMTVPCVALDDVSHGAMADYIKLDIEGAEQAALLGMRKTISNSKPHLAVSIYHRPDDLWILTQTLAELAPYADLFIRQHCLNAFETVLYAVPRG